jgi:hypothetical protein
MINLRHALNLSGSRDRWRKLLRALDRGHARGAGQVCRNSSGPTILMVALIGFSPSTRGAIKENRFRFDR